MNRETTKKITALGVVIFSFACFLMYSLIILAIDSLAILLVLNTNLSESILKIVGVISAGIALITATGVLTAWSKLKGIYAAGIMFGLVFMTKLIGNAIIGLGGYFTIGGLLGTIFLIIFALVGGVLGSLLKK